MFMKFRFSRAHGHWHVFESIAVCCYGNTNSTNVLLEQQWPPSGRCGHISEGTGGLHCSPR